MNSTVNLNMRPFGKNSFRTSEDIKGYHAHLYYDGRTKQFAGYLRREMERRFNGRIEVGRWRDLAPQGPNPTSHFQVSFPTNMFNLIVPFLALNRGELHILLHPNTGNGYEDHTTNVMWIGPSIPLDQNWLSKNQNV